MSSITDDFVPVKRGGAWGGFLNDCGAIATVVSGLKAVEVGVGCTGGLKTKGRICANIDEAFPKKRVGRARMKRMEKKRKREARESFSGRVNARLSDSLYKSH